MCVCVCFECCCLFLPPPYLFFSSFRLLLPQYVCTSQAKGADYNLQVDKVQAAVTLLGTLLPIAPIEAVAQSPTESLSGMVVGAGGGGGTGGKEVVPPIVLQMAKEAGPAVISVASQSTTPGLVVVAVTYIFKQISTISCRVV